MRSIFVFLVLSILSLGSAAQDSKSGVFERIMDSLNDFKPDTTNPPDDKVTRAIIELRKLRGGFNINEAIAFKLGEEKQENKKSAAEIDALSGYFRSGKGRKWLDNATTWIYRKNFSYRELKQLIRFYKTSAGQKLATEFPVIMLQTLRSAELIKEVYEQEQGK